MSREQCAERVYVRDPVARYTGRGSNEGFQHQYRRHRCARRADENGLCWQHQPGYLAAMVMRRWQAKMARYNAAAQPAARPATAEEGE